MKALLKKVVIKVIEWQARLVLKRHRPYIIAVTGNVGKTSAKEAIFHVISSHYHARKSQKSFNSEIGVPLTILGCPTGWNNPYVWMKNILRGFHVILFTRIYPQYLVLEIGADRPGDIKSVCSWLSPDTGVVTALGETPVHIEFFNSKEDLVAEKSELIKSLPSDGRAVLNGDEEAVVDMRSLFEGKPLFYGFTDRNDIKASHYTHSYDSKGRIKGFSFKVDNNGSSVPFHFDGFLGIQHVYAVLAGAAVGLSQGMNMVAIQEALAAYNAEKGRMRILRGVNGSTLLDDSYNASPIAVKTALEEMRNIKTEGRKIAILGDMLDLGKYTHEEHIKIGMQASGICDFIFSVGARGRSITETAQKEGMDGCSHFSDSSEAVRNFPLKLEEGDVVLIKGSQSMRMERVVESLLEDPKKAGELLVRQESYWKKK